MRLTELNVWGTIHGLKYSHVKIEDQEKILFAVRTHTSSRSGPCHLETKMFNINGESLFVRKDQLTKQTRLSDKLDFTVTSRGELLCVQPGALHLSWKREDGGLYHHEMADESLDLAEQCLIESSSQLNVRAVVYRPKNHTTNVLKISELFNNSKLNTRDSWGK